MAEFKVVSWSPDEAITDEKLDAMVSNDNYLRSKMMTGFYAAHGVRVSDNVKIICGLTGIAASKANTQSRGAYFGNFFSQSCKPVVTTGIVSSAQRMIWVTTSGLGTSGFPTRDGFSVHVVVDANGKNKKIKRNFYVAWHAIGY